MPQISDTPLLGSPGNWDELEHSYAGLQVWLGRLRSSVVALQSSINFVPVGATLSYPSTATLPTGYLRCDGSSVSRATYAALFAVIGTTFGAANNSVFTLPTTANSIIFSGV